jgi:ribosomal-protein-alanine N-acetyltransferase
MMVKLRPWQMSDAERLTELANNYKIAKFMRNIFPHPYGIENAKMFLSSIEKDKPVRVFAITVNNEVIGGTGVHPQDDIFSNNAEIGYWIGEHYWGKGYMSEAIHLITDHAFKNFPVNRVWLRIFGNNPASMKVAEKAGFTFEAKFDKTLLKNGELLDEYIYAKRR